LKKAFAKKLKAKSKSTGISHRSKKDDGKLGNDDLDRFNDGLANNSDKKRNKTIMSPLEKIISCE
jgi:hypothetical protein